MGVRRLADRRMSALRCRMVRGPGWEPVTLLDHCFSCEKRLATSVDSPDGLNAADKRYVYGLLTGLA